ncbi:aminopeptidase N-like [Anopheles marshallii]|uniref:aminopeptidase N-like n=1 Tax=Anopheles marshallii TaxID=1521116 RepID=UPI00237B9312|nr:aminopeptidase N-like [Anopheles marshallii]
MLLHWLLGVVGILTGLHTVVNAAHPAQEKWSKLAEGLDEEAIKLASEQELRYRLPTYIVPTHYKLYLETQVHTGNRSYSGSVDIHLDIQRQTPTIYVHNRGLRITYNELYFSDEGANITFLETLRYTEDAEREFTIFSIRRALAPAEYILRIDFEGQLRVDDDGFYMSSYRDENGARRYLASTQFQAISARSAFPCLDEPALKATFSVEIKHHPSYEAVANMPIYAIAGDTDGNVVTVFETTPPMSVYLLAFMVSDFLYTENEEAAQRVYARPNAIDQTQYALEAGVRIMNVFDEYLGLPYSTFMPKVDQTALTQFSAGAMENWGLCKYREEYLLYEPGVTTYRTQTSITTIIAHEYAHQWFGNVVTNKWWSYLWLNEGFATLYEFVAADMAYPERQYRDLFNVQVLQRALITDANESTRPMTFSRGATFNTIGSLFDNVAYSKGGSVLQMFGLVLSESVWQQVVRLYVERNALGSVGAEEFIEAMAEVVDGTDTLPEHVSVESFVTSWVDQPGFPVLEVRRSYWGEIILTQDRFYANRIVNDDTTTWMIPYTILAQGDSLEAPLEWQWLTTRAVRVPSDTPDNEWILANVNQAGFYRVNYDASNWYMLIRALTEETTSIPMHSRSQLVDDAFHLARSNRLDLEIALDLMTYLRHEREYPPWAAANYALNYFYNRMRGRSDYVRYQLFVDTLISDVLLTLDVSTVLPDERLLDKYLRQVISRWACRMEIESCLTDTRLALEREVNGEEPVHPDVSEVVYCYGLRTATTDAFQYLFAKLQSSDNRGERSSLIDALGCTTDAEQLRSYLLTAIGGELQVDFDPEERFYILSSVLVSRAGADALISFLSDNFTYVANTLGVGTLNSLIQSIAAQTNTPEEEQMLNELLSQLQTMLPASGIETAQATMARNLAWPSTREGVLLSYFLERHSFQPA